MTRRSGFTLFELATATGVLMLAAAVLLPTPSMQKPKSISLKFEGPPSALLDSQPSRLSTAKEYFVDTTGVPPVTGLNTGEEVVACAAQPGTGNLYGVTNQNRIVRINSSTGAATFQSQLALGLNDGALKAIATLYNFYVDSAGLYENERSPYEKWIRSDRLNSLGSNWFYIHPNGDLYEYDGGDGSRDKLVLKLGCNAYENPELLCGASQTVATNPQGAMDADAARHFYRPSKDNFAINWSGVGEKWIKGALSKKSTGGRNNPWYYILRNGDVHEWDGSENLSGAMVGNYGRGVYDNPALLYDANLVANPVNSDGLDQQYGFFFDRSAGCCRNLWEDGTPGLDLKWFVGGHNQYFFIQPDGDVYLWDRQSNGNGRLIKNLGPHAWDNIEQVVNDYTAPATTELRSEAQSLDKAYSLCRYSSDTDYYYNAFGLREKWLFCDPLAKTSGRTNPWVLVLPDGSIVEWDGSNNPTGNIYDTKFPQAWRNPNWLCDAYADGTVLNGICPESYAPTAETAPGDRLHDGVLDSNTTVIANMNTPGNPDIMTIATTNALTFNVNVKTGAPVGPARGTTPPVNETNEQRIARETVDYLNALRANKGLAPLVIDERLVSAAERKAKWMADNSTGFTTGTFDLSSAKHIINFEGQEIGMNKWVRDSGFPVPPQNVFPDNANFVESIAAFCASPSVDVSTSGRRGIDAFTDEGPGGGHYDHIYSDNKNIGIGIAVTEDGACVFLCYLILSPTE